MPACSQPALGQELVGAREVLWVPVQQLEAGDNAVALGDPAHRGDCFSSANAGRLHARATSSGKHNTSHEAAETLKAGQQGSQTIARNGVILAELQQAGSITMHLQLCDSRGLKLHKCLQQGKATELLIQ